MSHCKQTRLLGIIKERISYFMKKNNKIAIFEGQKIRRIWDKKQEKWYFSVIDIIAVLIEQTDFKNVLPLTLPRCHCWFTI